MSKAQKTKEKVTDLFGKINSDGLDRPASSDNSTEIEALKVRLEQVNQKIDNALVPQDDNSWLLFGTVRLTKTGLQVPADFTEEDKDTLGHIVIGIQDSSQFWMGDWANLYLSDDMDNNQRGEIYSALAEKFGIEHATLNLYASVCRRIPSWIRIQDLPFSHHREVANLPESLKGREEEFLNTAVENKWSVRDLKLAIQEAVSILASASKPDTIIDTKGIKKTVNQILKLYSIDTNRLSSKKQDDYRSKIAALRRILEDLESKLDT